jgi:hypothetical protein
MKLPELDLLSSELRNNPRFLQSGMFHEAESNAEVLCVAYQENIIDKDELEKEIKKEDFDYPISLFDENTEYESQEELFKAIASKEVDDSEGNFKPESQEYDDDY